MASLKNKFTQIADGNSKLNFDPLGNDEARLTQLRLTDIELDPTQPRKDLGDLEGLKASIKEQGIIQPLVVSPLDETRFLLIAGERRYRASQELGLRTVPALVRTVEQHRRLELQIIENLHRKDLDPFEEADGYRRLLQEFNLIHEQVAKRVGKSRTYITQLLSLNKIPEAVRKECQSTDIPISKDTFYNIAKQDTVERMYEVLYDAQRGLSYEEKRERARKGAPRKPSLPKKPKMVYETSHNASVIVQSKTDTLTNDQIVFALRDALQHAQE